MLERNVPQQLLVLLQENTSVRQDGPFAVAMSGRTEFRRINAGSAAAPEACHYLSDVSSDHAAPQMFPLPEQSCADERLMKMVGRRRGSSGQS